MTCYIIIVVNIIIIFIIIIPHYHRITTESDTTIEQRVLHMHQPLRVRYVSNHFNHYSYYYTKYLITNKL